MHCKSLWIKASAKCLNINISHMKDSISGPPWRPLLQGHLCITLSNMHVPAVLFQDGIRRGRPRADTVRELINEGENSSSRIRCNICNRVFPREKSLQAHKRTHTGQCRPSVQTAYMCSDITLTLLFPSQVKDRTCVIIRTAGKRSSRADSWRPISACTPEKSPSSAPRKVSVRQTLSSGF